MSSRNTQNTQQNGAVGGIPLTPEEVTDRLTTVEDKLDRVLNILQFSGVGTQNFGPGPRGSPRNWNGGWANENYQAIEGNIQDEFRAIKDSYQRVRLPQDLKIDDSELRRVNSRTYM